MVKLVTIIISLVLFTACSTDRPVKEEMHPLPSETLKVTTKKYTPKPKVVKHIKKRVTPKIDTIKREKIQYQNPTEVSRICFDKVGKVKNCTK